MSSYNKIEKFGYKKNVEDPVSLTEYVLFTDEREDKKYAVFKFMNNLNQTLHQITALVSEMDENGFILEKVTLNYGPFTTDAMEEFIPEAKLSLNPKCKTLSLKLISAVFEKVEWKDGKYDTITYTEEDFDRDYPGAKKDVEKKEEKKAEPVKKSNRRTVIKDITRANCSKAPRLWGIFLGICLIAFTIASSIIYAYNLTTFASGDFDLEPTSSKECEIVRYTGSESEVTIPTVAGNYRITSIADGAFKNSSVEVLNIKPLSLSIGRDAFKGSNLRVINNTDSIKSVGISAFEGTNLESVTLNALEYIPEDVFKNCASLVSLTAEEAQISRGALNGAASLKSLYFNTTNASCFYQLFGDDEYAVPYTLTSITTGMTAISSAFFTNCQSVTSLNLLSDPSVEYPSFSEMSLDGYHKNEYCELIDGKVVSSISENLLYVDSASTSEIFESVDQSKIDTIVLDSANYMVTGSMLEGFSNLKNLEVSSKVTLSWSNLISNSTIRNLSVGFSDLTTFFDYQTLANISSLTITGAVDVYRGNLDSCYFVSSFKAESANLKEGSLSSLTSLKTIEMKMPTLSLEEIGVSKSITSITLDEGSKSVPVKFMMEYNKITSLELPSNITWIGYSAFDCSRLSSMVIPDSVTSMELPVFTENCTSLKEVTTPFIGTSKYNPSGYSEFNNACDYTEKLTITQYESPKNFNNEVDYGKIQYLLLKGQYECEAGSLRECYGVTYLELSTAPSITIADLFGSANGYEVVVIDGGSIEDGKSFDYAECNLLVLRNMEINTEFLQYMKNTHYIAFKDDTFENESYFKTLAIDGQSYFFEGDDVPEFAYNRAIAVTALDTYFGLYNF